LHKCSELVSVIILHKKGISLIKSAIQSVLESDYKNVEIILVDCASQDGSIEFLKREYPIARILRLNIDRGYGYANNVGASVARGKYVLLLNDDVILPRDCISQLVKTLKRHKGHSNYVISFPVQLDWNGNYANAGWSTTWARIFYSLKRRKPIGDEPFMISLACVLVEKELLSRMPLNETFFILYDDCEWCWRAHLRGDVKFVLADSFYYHKGAGSRTEITRFSNYYKGRNLPLLFFICCGNLLALVSIPIIIMHLILTLQQIFSYRVPVKAKFSNALAVISGVFDFLKELNKFRKDRIKVQSERRLNEKEIMNKMISGYAFSQQIARMWRSRTHRFIFRE
jgi:GT2 family glycosyltransferase